MYHFVEDKSFLKRAQSICSEIVKKVEDECRNNNLNGQVFLIGSGAKNLVTQNEDNAIDFDYNLNVIACEDFYNCKAIKETVRKAFNKVMRTYNLSDVSDSTSSLTTELLHFQDNKAKQFSIDLAIVIQDDKGCWHRLIHEKTGFSYNDRYFWNQAKNSNDIKQKSDFLKKNNYWERVRKAYLNKKNMYLSRNDNTHPSFICYIEAVNEIYYLVH